MTTTEWIDAIEAIPDVVTVKQNADGSWSVIETYAATRTSQTTWFDRADHSSALARYVTVLVCEGRLDVLQRVMWRLEQQKEEK